MRLNFSAVAEADIREGVRRIGKVVEEQLTLYGSLTGEQPRREEPAEAPEGAQIVQMPSRRPGEGRARGT
jgi:2-aminoadipate transaminase